MINSLRLHELHAIRGWAALLVVIAHAKYPFWSGGNAYVEKFPRSTWNLFDYMVFGLDMLSSAGGVFVIVFFVLSGFFIARSVIENKYGILFFFTHRLIRIYIPVLGSLLVAYFLLETAHSVNEQLFSLSNTGRPYNDAIIKAYNELTWQSFLSTLYFNPSDNLSFFGFNYPCWSLFCEMLFYVSIPFITRKYLFISVAILLHIISLFISYDFISVGSYTHYALYFAMGFFLYEILISHHGEKLKQLVENNSDVVVILSFIFLLLSIVLGLFHFEKAKDDIAMLSAISFMLWILLGRETGLYLLAKKVVVNTASNFLGKISFSLYLTHAPFMILLYSLLNIYSGEVVYYSRIYWLTLFFIIPFAYLFFRVFERPSLLLLKRHKLIYRMNMNGA